MAEDFRFASRVPANVDDAPVGRSPWDDRSVETAFLDLEWGLAAHNLPKSANFPGQRSLFEAFERSGEHRAAET